MWSKIKIWRMLQWKSCRQKPDVLSSIQDRGNWWRLTPSAFFLVQNITIQRFTGFRFLCFISCCFQSGFDNLSVNICIYIYIYIYVLYILEFRSSGRNLRNITCLLFPQHEFVDDSIPFYRQSTAFKRWVQGNPMTCALGSQAVGLFYLR